MTTDPFDSIPALKGEIATLKRQLAEQGLQNEQLSAELAYLKRIVCTGLVDRSSSNRGRAYRMILHSFADHFTEVEVSHRHSIFLGDAAVLDEVIDDLHSQLLDIRAEPVLLLSSGTAYVLGCEDALLVLDLQEEGNDGGDSTAHNP